MFYRVEVGARNRADDPLATNFLHAFRAALPGLVQDVAQASWNDVYWIEFEAGLAAERIEVALREVFWDPILQTIHWAPYAGAGEAGLEKSYRAGVTDNVGKTSEEALRIVLGAGVVRAASGGLLRLELKRAWTSEEWRRVSETAFCNPLIESWRMFAPDELKEGARFRPDSISKSWPRAKAHEEEGGQVETIRLGGLTDAQLESLSRERLWALTGEEMRAILDHFVSAER